MADLLTLQHWMLAPSSATQPVARRGAVLLTRADLQARAHAWADTLRRRPERDCAVYLRDGFEFICVLFGAWQAGKTVWLPGDMQPGTGKKLRDQVSLFIGDFAEDGGLKAPDSAATFTGADLPQNFPALMVFTSGSTGEPTAIPKTLRQLDAEVAAMQTQWGALVGQAQVIASVPHQHFYGLLFKILWPICRGAVFEASSLDYPEEVGASLARTDSVWIASPALLSRLPTDLPWSKQNLRVVFCSGGPLSVAAAQQCLQLLGQWPREVYGSSETGALATRMQDIAPAYWRTLPGVSVAREPHSGQLEVRAPWLPDEHAWLMADRGEVQADGGFSLLGRADRIVKVAEKRISLDALERVLCTLPSVEAVRVFQFPEGRLGAVVILSAEGAQFILTMGRNALIEDFRRVLMGEVERVAVPRRWRFVADFPRNTLGKITGAALQALFVDQDTRPRLPEVRTKTQPADKPDQVELELFIPPDLLYFDGHFPAAPILPGVAQLDWAVAYARQFFNLSGPFQSMAQIKFQQVITPAMSVHLTLTHLPAKSAAEFRYFSAAGAHSSGRIVFGASLV